MRPIAADVLNWAGATLAWAAALGLDPLSPRLTGALAKNGVVDLGTGRLRAYSWPVMAITFGRQRSNTWSALTKLGEQS